jgi:hypothetical protein
MRTTIEISDELCRQLKRKAADEGVTIRQVVESALRVYLGKQTRRKGYELKWKTERGRILPGVRLDERDALFDLMDGCCDPPETNLILDHNLSFLRSAYG